MLSALRSLDSNIKGVLRPWDGLDVSKQVIDIRYLSDNLVQKLNKLMNTTHSFYIDGVEIIDMHKLSPAKQVELKGDILIMINNRIG